MQLHIQHDGQQLGPYSIDAVRSHLSAGSLQALDLAWHEGASGWVPLSSIPGIVGGESLHTHGPSAPPLPGTSALAIWSLVLGILSLVTLGITSIPGVICGHLARGKIKKSVGKLSGNGLAMAGLITGYIGLFAVPLLAAAGFAAGNGVQKTPRNTSLATATAVEAALNNFNYEYGYMPLEVHQDTTIRTDSAEGIKLLTILLGIETPAGRRNIRGVKFLSVREGKDDKNGLIYSPDGKSVTGLYDPWGGSYKIRLDGDNDDRITPAPTGGGGATLNGRRVAVWSDGADGVKGGGSAADDVKTW